MVVTFLRLRTCSAAWFLFLLFFANRVVHAQSGTSVSTKAGSNDAKSPDHVFLMVDQAPQFPGGHTRLMHYIMEHCHFPPETADNRLVGKIVMQFIVEKDGSLKDIKVAQGISEAYDKECLRVFRRMPKWSPGKNKGRFVRTLMVVPIKFSDHI